MMCTSQNNVWRISRVITSTNWGTKCLDMILVYQICNKFNNAYHFPYCTLYQPLNNISQRAEDRRTDFVVSVWYRVEYGKRYVLFSRYTRYIFQGNSFRLTHVQNRLSEFRIFFFESSCSLCTLSFKVLKAAYIHFKFHTDHQITTTFFKVAYI